MSEPIFRDKQIEIPKEAMMGGPGGTGPMPGRMGIPTVPVQVVNNSKHELPKYETSGASGMDLSANIDSPLVIEPNQTTLIPTGISVACPPGLEFQVRPRSGLSFKTGLRVTNSPGTIDSCYRGEVKVIAQNTGDTPITINDGDRIAQLVLCPVLKCSWVTVSELSETDRGTGGFGSTGVAKSA